MNRDAVPNVIHSDHKRATEKAPIYFVTAADWTYLQASFAESLADAERFARADPESSWKIYRLDSTVELVNGVIVVRSAE